MNMQEQFSGEQLGILNHTVEMAEDLVINAYKMSISEWLRFRYDIKTAADLEASELSPYHFAQVMRYVGHKKNSNLVSGHYDFYKICIQDHSILAELKALPHIPLLPFLLYIVIHELVHIVRFGRFVQIFDASTLEREKEEKRVHQKSMRIMHAVNLPGITDVLSYHQKRQPNSFDEISHRPKN